LAEDEEISLFEAMRRVEQVDLSPRFRGLVRDFVDLIEDLRSLRESASLTQLARKIWKKSGYIKELEAERTAQAEARLENLDEFLTVASEYETDAGAVGDLPEFLQRTALLSASEVSEGGEEGISLMTLHSAKGLEFPVVFMIGLEEGLFPHVRSIGNETEIEEERRLCYVGMTRAEQRLYLVYAWSRTMFGQSGASRPSRFLEEIPDELLEISGGQRPVNLIGGYAGAGRDVGYAGGRGEGKGGGRRTDISTGQTVHHAKWGDGIVVDIEGSGENAVATISFSDVGTKRVLLSYTPLELK
jgi:DNA helicase-2/ATP-dependent DNA helicase PcrA